MLHSIDKNKSLREQLLPMDIVKLRDGRIGVIFPNDNDTETGLAIFSRTSCMYYLNEYTENLRDKTSHNSDNDIIAIKRAPRFAFSFLKDAPQWITACISIIAAVAIEAYLIIKKPKEKFLTILLLCLVAGAIGNGIDRWLAVFNARWGVVDFIDPTFFANFNIADIYVTCSCIAMMVYFLFSKEERDTTHIKKKEKTIKESENSDNDLVFNDTKND